MKRVLALAAALLALIVMPINALAATYIQDNANMFSSGAKNQATQLIDSLQRQTGKEIVVYTVQSLNGQDPSTAADNIFRAQNVNGVLLFMSKQDRRLEIKIGQDTRQAISSQREGQIRDTVLTDFRSNKFDQGLLDGVNGIRSALLNAPVATSGAPIRQSGPSPILIGLLIIGALIVVWVIAGVIRARQQQPYFSYGQTPPPGAYGQPGYGPGYGSGWGGGGGFFSGLLGGLGGALLGNALFDAFRPRERFYDGGATNDPGLQNQGWMNDDAGQVSDSSADSGSWGDPGGGDWGGGGDIGGGDSGGSW
jgi:uncharacterized membrane protein YgcG